MLAFLAFLARILSLRNSAVIITDITIMVSNILDTYYWVLFSKRFLR